ncbi:hypothetical protein AVEN_228532-1 [Araneus ventricosus]|uniref:Tc1-like transposase DDE domain-containing protein n=1 Tax=Araneus ventricosus TaxID=182803 RepID=A0A4Y2DB20_ARAVE|nr:hypothetical protein AVEN_228532-1 [Araneus ventricosus]
MLSDSVILLYDSNYTARKTQEFLGKFKWEVWSHPPYSPDLAPNLGCKHLSGTRFSSKSALKTYCLRELAQWAETRKAHGKEREPKTATEINISEDVTKMEDGTNFLLADVGDEDRMQAFATEDGKNVLKITRPFL